MDSFEAREHAAESFFAHELEEAFLARMVRVKVLGDWASRTMLASPEGAAHYQDILSRIAISTPDDLALVKRVRDDLATAGVIVTSERVLGQLAEAKADR